MSANLIVIKARSKTGQIVEFRVAEIIEIDGQQVQGSSQSQHATHHIEQLESRLAAVEAALFPTE